MIGKLLPFGPNLLEVVVDEAKVVRCRLCRIRKKSRAPRGPGSETDTMLLRTVEIQIGEYLAGRRREFTAPMRLRGTDFQLRVWETLQEIPYGEVWSYGDVAEAIGSPRAARAVGNAVGVNQHLVLVPCHRVIQGDGTLGGFGCGVDVKEFLLQTEGVFL